MDPSNHSHPTPEQQTTINVAQLRERSEKIFGQLLSVHQERMREPQSSLLLAPDQARVVHAQNMFAEASALREAMLCLIEVQRATFELVLSVAAGKGQ